MHILQADQSSVHTPAPCSCQLINNSRILNPRRSSTTLHHKGAEPRVGWPLAQHVDVRLVAATILQVDLVQLPWRCVQALVVDQPGCLQRKEEALQKQSALQQLAHNYQCCQPCCQLREDAMPTCQDKNAAIFSALQYHKVCD
jgi:hypothetical protein